MVALNYQTMDTSMLMNFGLFNQTNGGIGYVLKTPCALGEGSSRGPAEMTVFVHSAYRLPKPNREAKGELVDAFVALTLDCGDQKVQHHETKVVNDNGFNPEWKETFKFQVRNWDIAILAVEVYDSDFLDREFLCGNAGLVCKLEGKGYRWMPLLTDRFEVVVFGGLLIQISFDDVQPPSSAQEIGIFKEETGFPELGLESTVVAPNTTLVKGRGNYI